MLVAMVEEVDHDSLVWDDDQSWAFPIPPVEENGGKILIDSGKILMDCDVPEQPTEKVNEAANEKKRSVVVKRGGGDLGSGESDDHELHIWTERERRKKMRNMFASLHDLIPHLHPRADKSTIVDEAVLHIKKLQETLDDLEKLKQEKLKGANANPTGCDLPAVAAQSREAFLAEQGSTSNQPPVTLASPNEVFPGQATFRTWASPNVVLNICGNDAHINVVCCPRKPGTISGILFVMDKYNLELVSAHVSSSDASTRTYMVHVRVQANGVSQQFPEPEASFVVEETYKQAVAEIMHILDS